MTALASAALVGVYFADDTLQACKDTTSALREVFDAVSAPATSSTRPLRLMAVRRSVVEWCASLTPWVVHHTRWNVCVGTHGRQVNATAPAGSRLEIVYVSQDDTEDSMRAAFAEMPWARLPWGSDRDSGMR